MSANIRLKLAKRIRQLRERKGLTQEALAEKSGVAEKHIQRLEGKNPNDVKIETLNKLAKAFGITCAKLLDFNR